MKFLSKLSMLSSLIGGLLFGQEEPKRWVVYYGDNLPPSTYEPYQVVVLEPDQNPEIMLLLEQGKTVLGYISLGEVSQDRSYFEEVKKQGILFEKNVNWPDSYFVDMRSKEWTERVIQDLIPKILFQRFSGIFIDTIDNAEAMEHSNPAKFNGMKKAAVNLIKTIRLHFPHMKIMLNRGFALLPEFNDELDMVLAEEIFATHNFKTGENKIGSQSVYKELVGELKKAQQKNPRMEVYTLDYWDPKDEDGIKLIYKVQRKEGFIPYVATIKLNEIIPEP